MSRDLKIDELKVLEKISFPTSVGPGITIGSDLGGVNKTSATYYTNIAIGHKAGADGMFSKIAMGTDTVSLGSRSIALGAKAWSPGTADIAIGYGAIQNKTMSNGYNVAIGMATLNTLNGGTRNTVLGSNSGQNITSGTDNVCIGYIAGNGIDGKNCIALGSKSINIGVNKNYMIGIGSNTNTTQHYAIAIGSSNSSPANFTESTGVRAIAIGNKTKSTGVASIAVGNAAHAYASNVIAIGTGAQALVTKSVAIGYGATANVTSRSFALNIHDDSILTSPIPHLQCVINGFLREIPLTITNLVGNTFSDLCITGNLYVGNVFGKSPINFHDDINVVGGAGKITFEDGIEINGTTTNSNAIAIGKLSQTNNSNCIAIGYNAACNNDVAVLKVNTNTIGPFSAYETSPGAFVGLAQVFPVTTGFIIGTVKIYTNDTGNVQVRLYSGAITGGGGITDIVGGQINVTANSPSYTVDFTSSNIFLTPGNYTIVVVDFFGTTTWAYTTNQDDVNYPAYTNYNILSAGATAVSFTYLVEINNAYFPGTDSISIGRNTSTNGTNSVSVGYNTITGTNSTAIGPNAQATYNGIAIGLNAKSPGHKGVAIGYKACFGTSGQPYWSIGIGEKALYTISTSADNNIAIGRSAGNGITTGANNIALGNNAMKLNAAGGTSADNVCLGWFVMDDAKICVRNVCIGFQAGRTLANASGSAFENIFIGSGAGMNKTVAPSYCVAIGTLANIGNGNQKATAIGYSSFAAGNNAIAIGSAAQATGTYAIAIGSAAQATGTYAIAIGRAALASGTSTICIGNNVQSSQTSSFNTRMRWGPSGVSVSGVVINQPSVGTGLTIGALNQAQILEVIVNTSSALFKTDIVTLEDVGQKIDSMRAVRYKPNLPDPSGMDNRERIGFIAEELDDVFPEFVEYSGDGVTPISINYPQITAILLREIQSLRQRLVDAGIP